MEKKEILYKYMSIVQLKRFLEIIYTQKIYAPKLSELNDVKEGSFHYPKKSSIKEQNQLKSYLSKTYICSLSKLRNNGHMFAIYGDSHKGVCIELYVTARKWNSVDVEYSDQLPIITKVSEDSISNIIRVKSTQWGDEKEVRFYRTYDTDCGKQYLSVKIKSILFGVKVSNKDFELYKLIIKGINEKIEVIHLEDKDIDYGFR